MIGMTTSEHRRTRIGSIRQSFQSGYQGRRDSSDVAQVDTRPGLISEEKVREGIDTLMGFFPDAPEPEKLRRLLESKITVRGVQVTTRMEPIRLAPFIAKHESLYHKRIRSGSKHTPGPIEIDLKLSSSGSQNYGIIRGGGGGIG